MGFVSKGTARTFILCCLMLLLAGCSSLVSRSDSGRVGHTETGKASFYGMKFQGRKTANGEVFKQSGKTAAHKTLPFGTKVKVTNTRSGKSVIVRINDRGPFVRGRIIDLSRTAFQSIGNLDAGVIPVKIEVIR